MGAVYVDYSFDASDEKTLMKKFQGMSDDARYENGHGAYSGNLDRGVRIVAREFKTHDEASDWVSNNHSKWNPALAVKVGDFTKSFHNTPKGKKALAQLQELEESVNNFDKKLLLKVATQKSLYKTCTHCGSKISVKHFVKGNKTECPVCSGEFVKTEKDQALFKKLRLALLEKNKEVDLLRAEYDKKMGNKKPFWYVGGWAAC